MSTGCNCVFVEVEPAKWYYVLEDYDAPRNAWDWREHARAYGPFKSEQEGQEHLNNNHANPGGWGVSPYVEGRKPDKVMEQLIKDAQARRAGSGVSGKHAFFRPPYR